MKDQNKKRELREISMSDVMSNVMRYNPVQVVYTENSMKADRLQGVVMDVEEIYLKNQSLDLHQQSNTDKYGVSISEVKLILRPLSQLIETITHKGNRFVPMIELAKKYLTDIGEGSKYVHWYTAVFSGDYTMSYNEEDCSYSIVVNNKCVFSFNIWEFYIDGGSSINQDRSFNLLHEWQFDLYRFIESGQAVEMLN